MAPLKDTYMLKLNDILESKQQHMGQFIENISVSQLMGVLIVVMHVSVT